MKIDYEIELNDAYSHAENVRNHYWAWKNSPDYIINPYIENVYVNYLLIHCYGKIEHFFKNIVADYFTQNGMPQKCVDFGNGLRERFHGSLAKQELNGYFRKELSSLWLDEIHRRDYDVNYKCKQDNNFTFSDVYMAVNSLTNARHGFAHGESEYSGSADDIMLYFKKAIVWLYELDDIIFTVG